MLETPETAEQRVTPLELFFDLVFVFAITQVTGFVAAQSSWSRLVEGLAILAVLWFAWSSYAWLGNTAHTDEGVVRVILLCAMAAMLIASLAVPHAFGDDGLIFGIAYFVVPMIAGIVLFAIGVERTLPDIAAHLQPVVAATLCGGPALYLVALSAFKRRNLGSFNQPRLVAGCILVALIPVATHIPALAALGMVTLVACGLIAFEFVRYSEARERIRHGTQPS
jgi:low temperature requirement protein LtrA